MDSGDTRSTSEHRTKSRLRPLAVATIFVLLVSSVLFRTISGVDPFVAVGLVGVLAVFVLVLLWCLSGTTASESDSSDDADDDSVDDSDVWNAIPSWQYEGRHVESGGLARGEQERALEDIQRQADELTDDQSHK
ncbi:hypothetical protein [Natronorubrum daqingense]|uniref:Uncharacterized protein n=1 Tax=Natronorubrum daqingense TaxID=588898 RepID=A0A1N7EP07_9EURY|nr:hypothetical protein [Natronorubrum daqingense]APX97829.1 hypothetical protein BB347_15055 [Natronorubrum daqingense]SIR89810.1 hypothetical protein SAMN05421809_2742 [Natronorubrum daqingense]